MSFYDLTKDNVLSANDLFKHHLKRDATVPSKGGQKAYEPDGSWMHTKALESFMQERTKILGEQRVEKLKSLVQGVWEQDKRLINLNKPGKFWAHMGFTDKRRNWLYPEEALFLMETSTLEVCHNGLPLSIQEAYNKFVGKDLSLEEYQVYSHLRRLGYVVLRHEAQIEFTSYEKQINLDKYMSKQSIKERRRKQLAKERTAGADSSPSASKDHNSSLSQDSQGDREKEKQSQVTEATHNKITAETSISSMEESPESKKSDCLSGPSASDSAKRSLLDEVDAVLESQVKKSKLDSQCDNTSKPSEQSSSDDQDNPNTRHWYSDVDWASCIKHCTTSNRSEPAGMRDFGSEEKKSNGIQTKKGKVNGNGHKELYPFPSIANKTMLNMQQPPSNLLPDRVEVNEDYNDILNFNVAQYRVEHPPPEESKAAQREEDREARLRKLEFSFAEWTHRKAPVHVASWAEYKQESGKALKEPEGQTPVDHLWSGPVTPLVRPQDAKTKKSILERLSVIQTADNEALLPSSDCLVDLKVSYSVYLPDSKFKKSLPGTPNHRVCIVKCSAEPPNLAEIQEVWSRFKDNVPLHCAVVDSGEIAFYIFDNTFKLDVLP